MISFLSEESRAYLDGYKNGQGDRRLGRRSEYSYFLIHSANVYVRHYSDGYRDGLHESWMGKQKVERISGGNCVKENTSTLHFGI
jgi:hypothetical protein